jgi:hypothetical protein
MPYSEIIAVIVGASIVISIIVFSLLIGNYDPSGPSSRDSNGYKK